LLDRCQLRHRSIMLPTKSTGGGELKLQGDVPRLTLQRRLYQLQHVLEAALHLSRLAKQQQGIVRFRI
jgi:hypothetical protein